LIELSMKDSKILNSSCNIVNDMASLNSGM